MIRKRVAHGLACLLGAGWILLALPEDKPIVSPLSVWEEDDDFATAYECETARRGAVAKALAAGGRVGREAEQRYRCERTERIAN